MSSFRGNPQNDDQGISKMAQLFFSLLVSLAFIGIGGFLFYKAIGDFHDPIARLVAPASLLFALLGCYVLGGTFFEVKRWCLPKKATPPKGDFGQTALGKFAYWIVCLVILWLFICGVDLAAQAVNANFGWSEGIALATLSVFAAGWFILKKYRSQEQARQTQPQTAKTYEPGDHTFINFRRALKYLRVGATWVGKEPTGALSIITAVAILCFVAALLLIPVFFFWHILVTNLAEPSYQSLVAQSWPQTTCVIEVSRVQKHERTGRRSRTLYSADIQYRYEIKGVAYQSNRRTFYSDAIGDEGLLYPIFKKYPKGAQTRCYVDPENPKNAVLNPSIRFPSQFIMPLIFLIFFMLLFRHLIRKNKNENLPPPIESDTD